MSRSIESLDLSVREDVRLWLKLLEIIGGRAEITSTRRTAAEQGRLRKRFLEGRSLFPACPVGTSAHEVGAAIDVLFPSPEMLELAVDLADIFGLRWGGERDPVHFQVAGLHLGCIT